MILALDSISELKSLVDASGGSRWYRSSERSTSRGKIDFNSGVATRIEDHTRKNVGNREHRDADGTREGDELVQTRPTLKRKSIMTNNL